MSPGSLEPQVLDTDMSCANQNSGKSHGDKLVILVDEKVYKISRENLRKFPNTKLGSLSTNDPSYNHKTGRYEFDWIPAHGFMTCLLKFYQTGCGLHLPTNLCHGAAASEIEFWGLKPAMLAPCCYDKYEQEEEKKRRLEHLRLLLQPAVERIKQLALKRTKPNQIAPSSHMDKYSTDTNCDSLEDEKDTVQLGVRDRIWAFFEDPHSSNWALAWSLFVGFSVWVSILGVGLGTVPYFREWSNETLHEEYANLTHHKARWLLGKTLPVVHFTYIETVTTGILLIDLCGIFFASRTKCRVIKSVMYPVQAFISIGMIMILALKFAPNHEEIFRQNRQLILTVGVIIKVLHVILLSRLTKTYRLLFLLFMSIEKSWRELALLFIAMSLGVMAFSTAMYYAELQEGTFDTMLDSYWWAMVTMTTVGYGDYTPKSIPGRLISSACFVCGVIIIAIPVAVIGSNFAQYYSMMSWIDRLTKQKKDIKNTKKELEAV